MTIHSFQGRTIRTTPIPTPPIREPGCRTLYCKRPARVAPSRNNIAAIHERLRDAILEGEMPAGVGISQVKLAQDFGVSRGPVREALRLLQREGLVDAELNRRVRVAGSSVADLEELYALRIVNEALAISATVTHLLERDLDELNRCLEEMDRLAGHDVDAWERAHRRFHHGLVAYAGTRIVRLIEQLHDHSERYRRMYLGQSPRVWWVGADEHRAIYDACRRGDPTGSAAALGQHLSRTALSILTQIAPDHEPSLVRGALRAVMADEGSSRHPARGAEKADSGPRLKDRRAGYT